jgi:hypothetical protein
MIESMFTVCLPALCSLKACSGINFIKVIYSRNPGGNLLSKNKDNNKEAIVNVMFRDQLWPTLGTVSKI